VSEQYEAAIARALVIAVPTGILTALTTWATTDDLKTILIAGGTAATTTFLARVGLEGSFDTRRDRDEELRPRRSAARAR